MAILNCKVFHTGVFGRSWGAPGKTDDNRFDSLHFLTGKLACASSPNRPETSRIGNLPQLCHVRYLQFLFLFLFPRSVSRFSASGRSGWSKFLVCRQGDHFRFLSIVSRPFILRLVDDLRLAGDLYQSRWNSFYLVCGLDLSESNFSF